jgi:predicted DNA-binding protein (MmcQ/YjbR family)
MDIDRIRDYCLNKPGNVREGMPFGEDVLVFTVRRKIFLLMRLSTRPLAFNVKCDPARAVELRERYQAVQPGYHMNKKYWNTVVLDGTVPSKEVLAMIDHSYDEVLKGLSKGKPRRPSQRRTTR